MTNPDYAHHLFVVDISASMNDPAEPGSKTSKAQVATKGIHDYIADQGKFPGKTTFSLFEFTTKPTGPQSTHEPFIRQVASFAPADSPNLKNWALKGIGWTPLRDGLGTAIRDTGAALAAIPEDQRPGHVYVIVATDGLENRSKEFTTEQLKALVTEHTDVYNWEFIFIGADIDAFAQAGSYGMNASSTMGTNTVMPGALASSYASTASAVSRGRATGQSVSYTTEERTQAEEGTSKP